MSPWSNSETHEPPDSSVCGRGTQPAHVGSVDLERKEKRYAYSDAVDGSAESEARNGSAVRTGLRAGLERISGRRRRVDAEPGCLGDQGGAHGESGDPWNGLEGCPGDAPGERAHDQGGEKGGEGEQRGAVSPGR